MSFCKKNWTILESALVELLVPHGKFILDKQRYTKLHLHLPESNIYSNGKRMWDGSLTI